VGVTAIVQEKALITDPDLPRKAREGRTDDILRCIGCNACIAHYHAGTPSPAPRTRGRDASGRPLTPTGFDAAELLAAEGKGVTLAIASVTAGEACTSTAGISTSPASTAPACGSPTTSS
jgi:hypothetical protein